MSDSLSNGSLLDRDAPPSSGGTSSGGTSRQVDAPAAGVEGPPADGHEARDIEAQELSSEDGYASDGADASGGVDAPAAGVEGPPADEEEERDIEAQELSSVEGDAADAVDASVHINAPAGSVEKFPVDGSNEREGEGLGRSAETAPAVEDALGSGDVEAVASGEVEKQTSGSVDGTPVEEVDLSDKETAPSESGILFKGLFGDVADDSNEYEYVDHPDPDKKCCERDIPKSKFVRTFKFFTRGYAVPWRVMVLVMLHTASIVGITFWTSRYWDKNNSEDCDSLWWCSPLAIDTGTATYVGFALFLLLSFRVNEAYERYTYCIRLWNDEIAGTIHSFCVLCSMAFPRGTFHKNDRKRIFSLAAAYAVTLKRDLRGERDLRELKSMCSPRDLAGIQAAPDMPGHCLYILHAYVMAASRKEELGQSGPFYTMLHGLILKMTSFQGSCMRIKNYKIAYGYIGHLKVFMNIWISLVPLALVETTGWLTILWVPCIAYGIFGMNSVADELADPFGYDYNDIRLGDITATIQKDVREIYKMSIAGQLSRVVDAPDMLQVPVSEGGILVESGSEEKMDRYTERLLAGL